MSIRDKVAIIGMGCSKFGERWDCGPQQLAVEAFTEALTDAQVSSDQIGAAWVGTTNPELGLGRSGLGISTALGLANIPVTRVENFCTSGTESFRGAAYAVASGAVDIALAIGVEKLKDTGFGGLPLSGQSVREQHTAATVDGPGIFAQLANSYMAQHKLKRSDLKAAMSHVSVKSHANGARNPKAHLRREINTEAVMSAPLIAEPLGLFDCCGVSDGAACAIITTPEIAKSMGKSNPVALKGIQLATSNGSELEQRNWNGATLPTVRIAAQRAYREAGISDPRKDIHLTEVHDCFSITELVLMEELGLSDEGRAIYDILDGRYDADGAIPCQIDGGLKCFGHPIGASGIRMIYELYLQLQHRAGDRQLENITTGLTHNLGGSPPSNVTSVAIFGLLDA